jgi:hypothetical protein
MGSLLHLRFALSLVAPALAPAEEVILEARLRKDVTFPRCQELKGRP